jgi:hypothetical protein
VVGPSASRTRPTTRREAEFLRDQNGWTGVPKARTALGFAVENSWSPAETLMRWVWKVDAERRSPLCNMPISTPA